MGGKGARPGAEVALREEEEDHRRASDVLLERPDVFEIIDLQTRVLDAQSEALSSCTRRDEHACAHVEKDFDAWQQQLQLALDDSDGVLTSRPIRGRGCLMRGSDPLLPSAQL